MNGLLIVQFNGLVPSDFMIDYRPSLLFVSEDMRFI